MKYFWRMYRIAAGLLVVFGVLSCKALRPTVKAGPVTKDAEVTVETGAPNLDDTASQRRWLNDGNKVLSVLIEVKDSVGDGRWRLKSAQIYEGKVKKGSSVRYQGYYAAYFSDANGNLLDSAFFESPLVKRIEAPGEKEGKLETNFQKKKEGVAFVRTNYKQEILELYIHAADGRKIATLNLRNIHNIKSK